MKKNSFRNKITQSLIIFTFSISILIASISSYSLYQSKIESLAHNQRQVLQQVEYEINSLLNKIENTALYISENYKNNQALLKSTISLNNNIKSIIILNKDGIIKDFYAKDNLNIYKGFDYSEKKYFKEVKNNINFYWSDVFLSSIDATPSLSYSLQTTTSDIIVIFIQLQDLLIFSQRFENSDKSHKIRIFDNEGIMILNPDNLEIVAQRFNAKNSSVFYDLIYKVKDFEQTTFTSISFRNKKSLLNEEIAMHTSIEKTGWKVLVREDYSEVLKSLKIMILFIGITLILFLILGLIIAIKTSKNIFISLNTLNSNISNIANGNYGKKVNESAYKEFDLLIENFKKMQIEIDKREVSLEKSLLSFKSLVDSTMEAIILHKDGICFDVNDVAVKMFAYDSKEDMIGHNFLDFFSDSSKLIVKKKMLFDIEAYEIECLKKNNEVFVSLGKGKFLSFNNEKIKVSTIMDISELKKKDKLLSQQSKMAAMGEMIENIAHQWRQPLSTISTASSGIKLEDEFNILTKNKLYEALDVIMNNTQYLSKTIDDFRNFFKTDKKEVDFFIEDIFTHLFLLIDSSFKDNNITLIKNINSTIKIKSYPNELTQALINIFNNSKDAYINKNIQNRYIQIDVYKKNNFAIISIKDNAGGIKEEIISKIFEPYFTTKHKAQGTGIGLYMTHQIIVDHMKGSLDVKNSILEINKESFYGCTFMIKFPL